MHQILLCQNVDPFPPLQSQNTLTVKMSKIQLKVIRDIAHHSYTVKSYSYSQAFYVIQWQTKNQQCVD